MNVYELEMRQYQLIGKILYYFITIKKQKKKFNLPLASYFMQVIQLEHINIYQRVIK